MKKIFFIFIIFLVLDFLSSQIFILDFLDNKRNLTFKGDIENRVHNEDYLYTFKKNSTFKSRFYDFNINIFTNNLGFRSKKVSNVDRSKKFFLLMGDSFVEGVGVQFDETIGGNLSKKTGEEFSSYQFLNGGVASYSTYIYLKKIKKIVSENKDINFKNVIVFLDKTDIKDDSAFIHEPDKFPEWKLIDDQERKILFRRDLKELNFWSFFTKQTMSGRLIRLLGDQIENFMKDTRDRYILSKKLNMNFFNIDDVYVDSLKSVNELDHYKNFYYDNEWKNNGIELAKFSVTNLLKIKQYLDKKNINFYVVLYPWPYEIVEKNPRDNFLKYIKKSLNDNEIKYLDTYHLFIDDKPYHKIKKFYQYNDIHFNKNGYKIISDYLFNELKKTNAFQ